MVLPAAVLLYCSGEADGYQLLIRKKNGLIPLLAKSDSGKFLYSLEFNCVLVIFGYHCQYLIVTCFSYASTAVDLMLVMDN